MRDDMWYLWKKHPNETISLSFQFKATQQLVMVFIPILAQNSYGLLYKFFELRKKKTSHNLKSKAELKISSCRKVFLPWNHEAHDACMENQYSQTYGCQLDFTGGLTILSLSNTWLIMDKCLFCLKKPKSHDQFFKSITRTKHRPQKQTDTMREIKMEK